MLVLQLLASPFLGGPEQQVLGLARQLSSSLRTVFASFAEHGKARPFLDAARRDGFEAVELRYNTPRFYAAVREVAGLLRGRGADVLCCNGYKPDILGWAAARLAGVPAVAVAHGWTGATMKVRCYDALDRRLLRHMDATVCVSAAQAARVRAAGVPAERVHVIRNAVRTESARARSAADRQELLDLFPRPPRVLIGAAGRLSPEKGWDVLLRAASFCRDVDAGLGFVIFGDGPLRPALQSRITEQGLTGQVILKGFCPDLPRWLPQLDMLALSSHTEGLPVILLEAFAAGLPVVATAVGGVPEVVTHGENGYLVPRGDAPALANCLVQLGRSEERRRALGARGHTRVKTTFTFAAQSRQYEFLFRTLLGRRRSPSTTTAVGQPARAGSPEAVG